MENSVICPICGWKIVNDPEIIERHNNYWHKRVTAELDYNHKNSKPIFEVMAMDENKQVAAAQVKASNKIQDQIDRPRRRLVMHVIMVDEYTGTITDQKCYPQIEPLIDNPSIEIDNKTGYELEGHAVYADGKIVLLIDRKHK